MVIAFFNDMQIEKSDLIEGQNFRIYASFKMCQFATW